jgi:hypothetical protein
MNKSLTRADFVGVIFVLVALILLSASTLHHAREAANRTKCISNLKQIGTGLALYKSDTYYGQMPPHGPRSLLYDNGDGLIGDDKIFVCPSNRNPDENPNGDYLRDYNWTIGKPNKVIVGDDRPNHRYDAFVFLFKDGHCLVNKGNGRENQRIDNVKGAYESDDCMYWNDHSEDTIPTDKYTLLNIRD